MSPPDTPPEFDPLAAQAAQFHDTLDRVGEVRVEAPPEPVRPSRPTTGEAEPPEDSWHGVDPLADHVDAGDNAGVVRDPEAGIDPPSVHVHDTTPPQPVSVVLEREPFDPNAGRVEHVDATAHLKDRRPDTDRFAGVSFDPTRGAGR